MPPAAHRLLRLLLSPWLLCFGFHNHWLAFAEDVVVATCRACLFDGTDSDDCVIYGKVGDEVVEWSTGSDSCKDHYGIQISSIDPEVSCASANAFVSSIRFGDLSNSPSRLGLGAASDGGGFFVEDENNNVVLADAITIQGVTKDCQFNAGDCYNFMKAYFDGGDGVLEMDQVCEKLTGQVRVDRNLEESTLRIRLCQELRDENSVPVSCTPLGTQVGDLVRADPERECSGFGFETPLSSVPGCQNAGKGDSSDQEEEDGADDGSGAGTAETHSDDDDPCDESKCVTRSYDLLNDDDKNQDHFCWGSTDRPTDLQYGYRSAQYSMMCADGFVPRIVEEEPPRNVWWDQEFRYFTCCPPDYPLSSRTTRHCSDPIEVEDQNISKSEVCDNRGARVYPRQYKITLQGQQFFACCDSNQTLDSDTSFLDDTECVPYGNDSDYTPEYFYGNPIGVIQPLSCSLYANFSVPRLPQPEPDPFFYGSSLSPMGQYKCCRSGPAYRYVKDSPFWITIGIELMVYSIAAIASAIIAIGLLIPLLVELKKGNNQRPTRRRRRNANDLPSYSTYNLYLVYLAIPDLLYALWRIGINACMVLQKEVPYGAGSMAQEDWYNYGLSLGLLLTYMMINLCINAIVSYQVLVLLKCSRAAQRIEQPTLTRVNVQVGLVFVAAPLLVVLTAVFQSFPLAVLLIVGGVGIPIVFVLVVSILILCCRYLPLSSSSLTPLEKAMRTLAIYFFRIVVVFIMVWIPGIIMLFYAGIRYEPWWQFFVFQCTPAVQTVVSTSMILTKPDVRKYVWNLLTLYGKCMPGTNNNQGGPNG